MIRAPPTRPITRAVPITSGAAAAAAAAAAAVAAVASTPSAPSAPPASSISSPPTSPPDSKTKRRPQSMSSRAFLDTATRRQRQREYYYDDIASKPVRPRTRRPSRTSRKLVDAADVLDRDDDRKKDHRHSACTDDSIRSYLHEIGEVKLLNADTEVKLAHQIAQLLELERVSAKLKDTTGVDPPIHDWAAAAGMEIEIFRITLREGLRAKEHMVAANLRLVVSIAKKYMNRGLTFQDLIQEGSIGLIRGAEKFDGNKGFKFSTYATWWIRQSITRAIADHSRPIRLPVHVNDTIAAIKKTTKLLTNEFNRPPVEAEIAERMQLSVEKLRFLSRSSRSTVSLETPIGRNGRESTATLGSFIMWNGDNPEEATMKNLLREDLENVLNTLSPRERDVVRMRYGFDDGKMKTLEEIGSLFAVTRERIRQIEAKALRKLRHPNRNAVLREYVYEEQ